MPIYLDYSNVKTEGGSPGEDSHVDEAILTWPRATVANLPSALVEVRLHAGAGAGCCVAVPSSAQDGLGMGMALPSIQPGPGKQHGHHGILECVGPANAACFQET